MPINGSTKRVVAICLVALALGGCYSFRTSLLKANDQEVENRIPPLRIGQSEVVVARADNFKGAQYQSDLVTVFERELEKNIFLDRPGSWGYIELKVVDESWHYTAVGTVFAILSGFSLYTLDLLGLPENQIEYTLEIEIAVLDRNKDRVEKFTYEGTKKSVVGPFYYNGGPLRRRELRIELFQELLSQFKEDVASKANSIGAQLASKGQI